VRKLKHNALFTLELHLRDSLNPRAGVLAIGAGDAGQDLSIVDELVFASVLEGLVLDVAGLVELVVWQLLFRRADFRAAKLCKGDANAEGC
jgi:hypothetical protein